MLIVVEYCNLVENTTDRTAQEVRCSLFGLGKDFDMLESNFVSGEVGMKTALGHTRSILP
jgi:hypothetical protein